MYLQKMKFKKWYFGHYHENRASINFDMLCDEIKELGAKDFIQRLGRPLYRKGEKVWFYFDNGHEKIEKHGEIHVIDSYGTFGQTKEVSYDIYATSEKMLYKHIPESDVID